MPDLPHDTSDVYLAPVALALDRLLNELGALTLSELLFRIALQTDHEAATLQQRRELLLELLERDVDPHGWALSWSDRGLCLSHADRQLVLGLSTALRDFVRVHDVAGKPQ